MNKRYKQLWATIGSMGLLAVIFDTFPTLMRSVDYFLQSKQLTVGAVLMMMVPFFMILSKISKEKEKRRRTLHIEMTQQRMERNQKKIMDHWGIEGEWESNLQQNGSEITRTPTSTIFYTFLQSLKNRNPRRKTKMREYLKKLGRTKLQVYIVFSIVNIYTLFSTLSGHTSISTELDPYMPAINIFAQVVGNWIYTHYQGKVDVVTAQNGGSTDAKPTIDLSANK